MASQKKRNGVLLLTETIPASSATQRISNQSAEQSPLILPGPNSTTRIAETGRRGDPFPCMNATWEPELRCPACRTIARVGMGSLAGRTRAAWTPAKETSGKIIQFYNKKQFPQPPWRRALMTLLWTSLLSSLHWPVDPYVCAPNDQVEAVQVRRWEEAPPVVVGEAALVIVMENQWRWTIRSAGCNFTIFTNFTAQQFGCSLAKISPVSTAIQFWPASGGGTAQQGFGTEERVAGWLQQPG